MFYWQIGAEIPSPAPIYHFKLILAKSADFTINGGKLEEFVSCIDFKLLANNR